MNISDKIRRSFKDYATINSARIETAKSLYQCLKECKKKGKKVAIPAYKEKVENIKNSVKHILKDDSRAKGVSEISTAVFICIGTAIVAAATS
tara:strand:- start:1128 stop:1406 length:279 start_codon:yes stop_codon:yes gene_type:complete